LVIDDGDLFYASIPAKSIVQVPLVLRILRPKTPKTLEGFRSLRWGWKQVSRDHEERDSLRTIWPGLVVRGDCDGTTGCAFANKNANPWETGPGLRASDVGGEWGVPGVVPGMKVVRIGERDVRQSRGRREG
jgi:hypothetical protein